MMKPLRVLIVEDSEDDALLMIRELKKGGYDPEYERVETAEAMRAALFEKSWDVILCDYQLPRFNGLAAIALLKETGIDIPLIIVSGAIGEETAADCMRLGARDYIMKGNLSRLVPAIERELKETESRVRRKQADEAWQRTFDATNDAIWILDHDQRVLRSNKAAERYFHRPFGEMIGKHCWEIVHETTQPIPECPILRVRKSLHRETMELQVGELWFEVTVDPILDATGRYSGAVHSVSDITERKQAETALRRAEENFRRSLDDSPLGVRIVSSDGETLYANRAILDIYGYGDIEELRATPAKTRYTGESYAEFQIRRQKRRQGDYTPAEYEIGVVGKDGEVRHLQVLRNEVLWNGERRFQVIYRDITRQKRLEAQLLQAQKMEAIGTLAGGLAHDFNNLLTGILGNASLAKIGLDPSNRIHERLEQIETIVESGANLTRQLLSCARGGRIEIRTGDLIEIIEKTADVFGRTRREVMIHKEIAKDLRLVEMDHGQMEQVFLNLLVNAWQAMPGGGDIYLSAVNADLTEADVRYHSLKPGRYVIVSVTDTGVGMDEKTRARIFEPFFTTREMGRGTGLGLAMVYGIVNRHGGFINVYSEPGRGTTFRIYLPASEKEALPEPSPAPAALRGAETILIVDDERMNLNVCKDSLEYLGYRVYTAENGPEALALYSEKQGEINLVLLDMIMPGMSGGNTYDGLKEINPDIRVILCSGYSQEGDAQRIMDKGCNGFIQKPFTLTALSREIRKALEDRK
jgi:PAS domain S-box-containing protein